MGEQHTKARKVLSSESSWCGGEWTRESTLKWCEQQHSFLGMLQFCPSHWTQRYEGRARWKFIIIWIPAETKFCNSQLFKTSNCYLPQIHCMRRKKNYFFIFNVLFSKACGSDSQVSRYTHSLWICTDKSHFNIAGVVSIYNWIDVMCGLEGNYLKFRARSQLKS